MPRYPAHVNYARSRRPYDERIAALVADRLPAGGVLLDIGCGVGHGLAAVRERRADLRLIAADRDTDCLRQVCERGITDHMRPFSEVADLRDLRGRMDGVVLCHVLEHTLHPSGLLLAALGMLKPTGQLFLAVPNPVRPRMLLANVARRKRVRSGHVHAWDRSHWINFLEVIHGLPIAQHTQDYVPVSFTGSSRPVRWVECRLTRLLPWFSFSHISVVNRPARLPRYKEIEARLRTGAGAGDPPGNAGPDSGPEDDDQTHHDQGG